LNEEATVSKWTISDIAREAHVSKTTVSRVLNGRPDVDAETSARVLALVKEIGYVPSARAVQLAKGKANAIGLLAPFDTSAWMIEVLRGAMERVQAANSSLVLHAYPRTEADEARLAGELRNGAMDALIVVSLQRPLPVLETAAAEGLPVIVLDDYGFNGALPAVVPDESAGISAAVDHLVDMGRTRFAFLAGVPDNPVTEPRLEAFRAALARRGFKLDAQRTASADFTLESAQTATAALLARGAEFDALFASSDAMAIGAMRALKHHGLSIPRDVSVVGFDDFSSAEYAEPRLTTVHNPLYEMSARAATFVLDAVRENRQIAPVRERVQTFLTVRDSSDPGLKADPASTGHS
jgi:LacI family transcriptional regulator